MLYKKSEIAPLKDKFPPPPGEGVRPMMETTDIRRIAITFTRH